MGGLILAVIFGGIVGYAYNERQDVRDAAAKAKRLAKKVVEGARLPQPGFMVHLPDSEKDYETLSTVICECALLNPDLEPELIRNCVLAELYPDFPWPPIVGDHSSVEQLWTIVSYEVGRRAVLDTLCPKP